MRKKGRSRARKRPTRANARTSKRASGAPLFSEIEFEDRLQLEMRRAERYFVFLSLLLMRVDCADFRAGRWRWRAKRDFLPDVSEVLKNNTRDVDSMFTYPGERFAFLMPETNDEGAYEAAQRLRRLVENAKLRRLSPLSKLRVSFGLSSFPSDARNKPQLVKNALRSLAEAIRVNQRRLPEPLRAGH